MYKNVILIPYRDRAMHLDYFLKNSAPLLHEQLPDTRIVVVEQTADNRLFNRGKLLNVGFGLYKDKTTYFITHDVDVNPKHTILNAYKEEIADNVVKGIYTSACNTLGGIIKIKSSAIHRCNGFPNDFWGWGVEDKALQNRCDFFGLVKKTTVLNDNPNRADYFMIYNDVDDRKKERFHEKTDYEYNVFPRKADREKITHILQSGLNTLTYKVVKQEVHELYDHVLVQL